MRQQWHNKLPASAGSNPPASWVMLSFFCVLVVIAVLGSSSSTAFDSVNSQSIPDYISNYRRLKEQADVDYLDLSSLPFVTDSSRDIGICGREKDNFVPCYNVSANILAGFKDGEEYDRHCEPSLKGYSCLIRPPKDYKIPLRWPAGRDVIWKGNVKITQGQFLSSGSMTKRLMLLEENQIAFHSEDGSILDGVRDYSRQIADMIGLGSDTEFLQAGVQNVLDIECGFGSFGANLVSLQMNALCIAAYEPTGSQVQLALERGLPAMIGNFISHQLPYPSLSFDMVHCAQCGIVWDDKNGAYLIEVDRLLRPGGYIVLTSPKVKISGSASRSRKRNEESSLEQIADTLCWSLIAQQDETFIWQKTVDSNCYKTQKGSLPVCNTQKETPPYYQPLASCISRPISSRWIPVQNRSVGSELSTSALEVHGIQSEEYNEDSRFWVSALRNYWSLLTPLIFSDHPKRPGVEDPLPPYNMIRNVMDMNARYGGLNAAFLEESKLVWVMNVVPVGAKNTLPFILERGFAGSGHDWCEPFPTYPRTYDLLHANGLLSSLHCSMLDLLLEMDRILRPEGWVIFADKIGVIDAARTLASQLHWEARLIDVENGSDLRLLVCQKPFVRR